MKHHQETTGMGLQGQSPNQFANQPSQVRAPIKADQKWAVSKNTRSKSRW